MPPTPTPPLPSAAADAGAPPAPRLPAPADLPAPRLSDNARKVLENRYLAKDAAGRVVETPRAMLWRVAAAVAAPETEARWPRTFYERMARGEFLPNSPTLMNAGREMGMLSACFVLPVEDSIDGIFSTLRQVALIQKAGGGTGFSFSRLRPDGDVVQSSGGRTSGPLSFIDAFSAATEAIQQGAFRRGANMGVLRCDHPDVVEFARAKDDLTRWTNYNVSIAATDAWMQRVTSEAGAWAVVVNPRDGRKAWLRRTEGRRASVADYEAYAAGAGRAGAEYWTYGEIFDLVVRLAWKNGEPGLLFLDRANADNQLPELGDYEATNPCVVGDTWVLTEEGPRRARELVGQPARVAVHGDWLPTGPCGFFATGVRDVVLLRTVEGHELRLTADHRLLRADPPRDAVDSAWIAAGALRPGDRIALHDHGELLPWPGPGDEREGWLLGVLVGDGNLREKSADLSVWAEPDAEGRLPVGAASLKTAMEDALAALPHRADFAGLKPVRGRSEWRGGTTALRDLAVRYGMRPGAKKPGPAIERTSCAFHRGFLRGLFDTDGSVQGSQAKGVSIRLAQSDLETLRLAQRMLLRLGIAGRIYARRAAGAALLPDGRGGARSYPTAPQWELIVTRENLARFALRVGFTDAEKAARLQTALGSFRRRLNREDFIARVAAVEPCGREEVFDVEVPGAHCFDANGLVAHNCGEQVLPAYGSCNLGSINLSLFVKESAAPGARWQERFDFAAFDATVADAVRFLDDVVTINRFPVDEIRARAEQERRIGLGVMGFADLLYALGIRYGAPESLAVARALARALTDGARRASEGLAAEGRPPFGAWPGSRPQREGLPPRRNSYLTTVAPTGTISILAGCSGGIEPLFSLAFRRQVMKDSEGVPVTMIEVNPSFRAALEAAGLPPERAAAAVEFALEHGTIRGAGLPPALEGVFVTAHDVTPEQHVRMQAAWQTAIDNAVSKTINLPHDAGVEDVRAAYELAWREGCKGVTVYRDGCRSLQPMALGKGTDAAPAAAPPAPAPTPAAGPLRPARLPEIMPCVRVRQTTPFGNMHVKISLEPKSGREMEVFAQLGKGGDLANSDLEAICRMVSLYLRVGGSLEDAVKQLEGIGSTLTVPTRDGRILSLADGLARALHRWRAAKERFGARAILLGEADLSEVSANAPAHAAPDFKIRCPACPDGALVFEEGCCKCPGCGYSQC